MNPIVRILALSFFILNFQQLEAVDVSYEGYFRSRYNFYYNLDMDRDQTPQVRAYTDIRFRLNPTFFLSDKARIRTSLNFLDGVLGDNPFRASAYNNPALSTDRYLDPTEAGLGGNIGTSIDTTTPYGGTYSSDGGARSTGLTPIQMRRVWGEFETPYGTLMVGRMPHQFGYGIYANAGDEPTQEVGSSRDRILFDTSFGSYYMRPGLGWTMEGALDQTDDDFMEIFFVFGRKTDIQDIGFYLGYNSQDGSLDAATNGSLLNLESTYWNFDFFARRQFGNLDLGAEFLLVSGNLVGKDLLAMNGVVRAQFPYQKFKILGELGYSSGTSDAEFAANQIKTFSFARDYDVALILFEEALPGGKTLKNLSQSSSDGIPTAPHSGAISNAFYPRIRIDFEAASFLNASLNVISPLAVQTHEPIGGRWYGVEYDILTEWSFSKFWSAELSFGHFLPGSFYKYVSSQHSVVLGRAGVTAKF